MFNQMFLESQKKVINLKMPNNHDSALIKSFLKDSNQLENTEKKVISSSS
ncbi:hypothetical protein MnTg01_00975 [archaeon MnTg01]|nr:hypothetical protein MnTg01_00975 [archaeon MnTg01]